MNSNDQSTAGRVIGYLPGWKTPPSASSLSSAGYTHIIVAFGVFDMGTPGNIYPAFSTVSAEYINTLHSVGIKVLLSIGGASTSINNTTVNFDQVVKLAPNVSVFKTNFINSITNLISQYGFDGIDIDIEQGFNNPNDPTNVGTKFTNPVGDIRIMADIINTLHSTNPSLLISLAPQCANVSPSSAFDNVWDNYSALIMLTHDALSWVGVQLYNTGSCWGINQQIYVPSNNNSNIATSPDFAVALATDLLENWPTSVNGRSTGWNPYISYLTPSQVVLGYPSPNSQGASDGAAYAPPNVVNRAIVCLRTAQSGQYSCDTYVPPRAYPGFGGVFTWEVTYDQDNNFQFAKGIKNCVINGNCGGLPTPTPTPTPTPAPTPTSTATPVPTPTATPVPTPTPTPRPGPPPPTTTPIPTPTLTPTPTSTSGGTIIDIGIGLPLL